MEARVAKRARIVLMAADGCTNREIGETVDLHYNQVGMWRKRYDEYGLAGLDDLERSGRPCVYDHDDVLLLVKLVTEEPPDGSDALDDGGTGRAAWRRTGCRSRPPSAGGSARPSISSPGRSSPG